MAGRDILTVEGVAFAERLHPVQDKMVECHGSQCGYCTPGFIMSLFEGYYRDDLRTNDQLDDQLCGNLCRCTGYRAIRTAAIQAFSERHRKNGDDTFIRLLQTGAPALSQTHFSFNDEHFHRPTSLPELLSLMARFANARLVAGATELGLEITKRYKKFPALLSVEAIAELKQIECNATEWRIGAAVTLTAIEEVLAGEFPALAKMLRVFGSRQIRNRATMGGNIVTASPIGDSAPVLLALGAKVVLASLEGDGGGQTVVERTLPIEDFFVAYRKTALGPGEILKTIIVPRGTTGPGLNRKCHWYKVSRRREMDISTVAGCFAIEIDARGGIHQARLAYGGVGPLPLRARNAEAFLIGKTWTRQTLTEVLPILSKEFTPISDVRGDVAYRRALITTLFQKFFEESTGDVEEDVKDRPLKWARSAKAKALPAPHESAHKHVTGEAVYTDDLPPTLKVLEVSPVCSPHARARILKRDASAARALPGVRAVILAEDIPGLNDVGTKHDEVLLPDREVSYHGQIVALIVGETAEICREAANRVVVEYEPLPAVLTLQQAIEQSSFHNQPNFIRRGDLEKTFKTSPHTFSGSFELGGQEHFYLETQAAWAEPGEDNTVFVCSSTQHPSEVQAVVAHVLDLPANKVIAQSLRMGGGFGGKETQAALPAALAALGARHTGSPVRVRLNRDQDMAITGHRHPFLARFDVGFDAAGHLLGARIHLYSNGGWALDLSQAVTDRALFHLDNSYFIPAVEFRGQVAKTNLSSNTAFRGFGGPQGMLVIEEILDRVARRLDLPPEMVRERNLYRGRGETNTTPYGQEIADNRIQTIWRQLKSSSTLARRRKEIARWNAAHRQRKRGIAMTPVKFGISFTVTHLNQAGALVHVYQDGTIQVNHGGAEMGQGVHTNITAIAVRELGVRPEAIRIMPTSTDKIPNTSATAASCGTDLNGAAVKNACEIIRSRLVPVAARLLRQGSGRSVKAVAIDFADGFVFSRPFPRLRLPFAQVVRQAYLDRVSLSATGFYCTPGIHWDRGAGRGHPFHYFACGAAVTEVEVDGFTGMHRVLRVDILHDAGQSINEGINRGQIEGGFIQGMGWLTTEKLKWDEQGRLLTHSPDTYKIPSIGDAPPVFNVGLFKNAAQKNVVYGSKAVGEPPLMLAISVREAIRDAVAAFGNRKGGISLSSPATCEAIFTAITESSKQVETFLPPRVASRPKARPACR
jgi:xanthine dehydrogenase molybdopterin binding subunit/xanthine dehydrogenase small subunit